MFDQRRKTVHLLLCFVWFIASSHLAAASIHISVVQPKVSIEYFYDETDLYLETHKYLEIKNGTKLQLRCSADREIRWLFNRKEHDYLANFVTQLVSANDTVRNKFIVDLIINSAEYNQTGEYSCMGSDDRSDDRSSPADEYLGPNDRVYLFVYGEYRCLEGFRGCKVAFLRLLM